MGRAPCCDKVGLKKGPWTPEEDQILISFIQKHGHSNWRALPKQAGLLRCGKSCRLRWINYLRPDIKRGNFTIEEEETIIQLHEMMGNRWSAIAAKLPGRTDNEIKNVWHTHLKKRLEKYQANKPQGKKTRTLKPTSLTQGHNVTNSNSTSTNNFPETSVGTVDNVAASPGPSYSSDDFSSVTDVSSVEFSNNVRVGFEDDQFMDIQQSNLEDFPIIDESFWSSNEFTSDGSDMMINNQQEQMQLFSQQITVPEFDNSLSSPSSSVCIENGPNCGVYDHDQDNMEFWLDVFVRAGGAPELPEF